LFPFFTEKNYVILPTAKDCSIGEGDTGLNTGGMGKSRLSSSALMLF
jgi:phosphoribosylamine-glycine ligase